MTLSRTLATALTTLALTGAASLGAATVAHAADGHHRGPHRPAAAAPGRHLQATVVRTVAVTARGATPTTA